MGHDLGVWLLRFLRNAVQKSLDDLEKLSRDPTCGVHLQGASRTLLPYESKFAEILYLQLRSTVTK